MSVKLIIQSAFSGHAVVGGFIGAGAKEAVRFGITRGLFSNESGMEILMNQVIENMGKVVNL